MSGDMPKSVCRLTMPLWFMKPSMAVAPSTTASSPVTMPPLMRALKAFPLPAVVTPGIMMATATDERGAPFTVNGKLCSVSGLTPPSSVWFS